MGKRNGSLNPRPGIDGITTWKGWCIIGSVGTARGSSRGEKARLVSGNAGISSKGIALWCLERMCMKCIRIGVGIEGGMMVVRN